MLNWFSSSINRNPTFGYLPAAVSTSIGTWALVENVTKLVGLASVIVGLIVGIYTLRIQKRTWERGGKK